MMKSMQILYFGPKKIQLLFLLLIVQFQSYGQPVRRVCEETMPAEIISGTHLLCMPYRDINPFDNLPGDVNQWGWGTVYLHTGDSLPGRYLLYNALGSNLLWVKYASKSGLLVEKSTVKGFVIRSEKNDRVIAYEYFPIANWYYADRTGAFFEVLVKDTVSLFRLSTIEKFPMSDNLKAHNYYFVHQSGSGLNRILLNRRSLCNALEYSKEFKKHLRNIHLRTNKRERIIKAVQEYNRFTKKIL